MSFRKEDWPLTAAQLESVIALRETTLVEFKREWWTGSGGEAKAKIARGVMALANTVGRDELGLLVIGVGDESVGGAIVPVVGAPEGEAVVQILSGYMSPPANIDCRHYDLITGRVSVIAVFHSPARPHHPTREYSEVLSTREVYVRRGKQVGVLTVPELERMIRDKDATLGALDLRDPVQFGFVSFDEGSPRRAVLRLQNVVTEPVSDVAVTIDARLMRDPETCSRCRRLTAATLKPGEVVEVAVHITDFQMCKVLWRGEPPVRRFLHMHDISHVGDRWYDLVAHVTFRDADGFIRSRDVTMAVEW